MQQDLEGNSCSTFFKTLLVANRTATFVYISRHDLKESRHGDLFNDESKTQAKHLLERIYHIFFLEYDLVNIVKERVR